MSYRVVYGKTVLECNDPDEALKLAEVISLEQEENPVNPEQSDTEKGTDGNLG